ncbi:MAG: hypothetical protein RR922_01890 [Clostridia bacterium]
MKVCYLRKKDDIEYDPIILSLNMYIKNKLIEKIDEQYYCKDEVKIKDPVDVYIIFSDNFRTFCELYNQIEDKSKIMLFTNNADASFIIMCLKFIKSVAYLRIKPMFCEASNEYEKYNLINTKRLTKSILGFIKSIEYEETLKE